MVITDMGLLIQVKSEWTFVDEPEERIPTPIPDQTNSVPWRNRPQKRKVIAVDAKKVSPETAALILEWEKQNRMAYEAKRQANTCKPTKEGKRALKRLDKAVNSPIQKRMRQDRDRWNKGDFGPKEIWADENRKKDPFWG